LFSVVLVLIATMVSVVGHYCRLRMTADTSSPRLHFSYLYNIILYTGHTYIGYYYCYLMLVYCHYILLFTRDNNTILTDAAREVENTSSDVAPRTGPRVLYYYYYKQYYIILYIYILYCHTNRTCPVAD